MNLHSKEISLQSFFYFKLFICPPDEKNTKMFQEFTPNLYEGSAIDLGEIANKKKCDNKIYFIIHFNYLIILRVGRNYRLKEISENKGLE